MFHPLPARHGVINPYERTSLRHSNKNESLLTTPSLRSPSAGLADAACIDLDKTLELPAGGTP